MVTLDNWSSRMSEDMRLRDYRPRTQQAYLPVVLSRKEVRVLLSAVRHPMRRMALTTIYALGLRLGEGLRLESGHLDADRRMVWVRDGKGAKDRAVVLPRPLLGRLRRYWKEDRPKVSSSYLFISEQTGQPPHPTT